MKYMRIEIRDQHGKLLKEPDVYPCVETLLIVVELPESDAEHRRGADADQHKRRSRIFSGDYSKDMWHDINNAKTVAELRRALYFVCCRLQELESRMY